MVEQLKVTADAVILLRIGDQLVVGEPSFVQGSANSRAV